MTEARVGMDTCWGFAHALTEAARFGWAHGTNDDDWPTGRELNVLLKAGATRPIHTRALRTAYANARKTVEANSEEIQ